VAERIASLVGIGSSPVRSGRVWLQYRKAAPKIAMPDPEIAGVNQRGSNMMLGTALIAVLRRAGCCRLRFLTTTTKGPSESGQGLRRAGRHSH
jgi:hypothetical protein